MANPTTPGMAWEPFDERHYSELKRRTTVRLILLYLSPVLLLGVFFFLEYDAIVSESNRLHLQAIAESQANTLDLFLSERLVNLSNVIEDSTFPLPPTSAYLGNRLQDLQRVSEAFMDLGYFSPSGVQIAYAGPYPELENRDYSGEAWFRQLYDSGRPRVITDIYRGFRGIPHFTVAISRNVEGRSVVFRATLDPRRIYEFISSLEGSQEVRTAIVSQDGIYQLVPAEIGQPGEQASLTPPRDPRYGYLDPDRRDLSGSGYAWLRGADWAVLVQQDGPEGGLFGGQKLNIVITTLILLAVGAITIRYRAGKLAELTRQSDLTRAQLIHAARLASVGELAAGIAHEINNPLAAINEEAGLLKDALDPDLDLTMEPSEIREHLDSIHDLVFRCRDITHKLLGFVRQSKMTLDRHDIHRLIDEVVDGLLGPEVAVTNIEVQRKYDRTVPELITDGRQLQQVFLNIFKNAVDAIGRGPGTITITTSKLSEKVRISFADSGCGMNEHQLARIFLPFFTTKEVGKGTGLGLSVSYGIIKSLGGEIEVESHPGRGSVFAITLPLGKPSIEK